MISVPVLFGEKTKDKKFVYKEVTALRHWCRKNMKKKWYTVHHTTTHTSAGEFIFIFVFESEKDAMMFNLYRRY